MPRIKRFKKKKRTKIKSVYKNIPTDYLYTAGKFTSQRTDVLRKGGPHIRRSNFLHPVSSVGDTWT